MLVVNILLCFVVPVSLKNRGLLIWGMCLSLLSISPLMVSGRLLSPASDSPGSAPLPLPAPLLECRCTVGLHPFGTWQSLSLFQGLSLRIFVGLLLFEAHMKGAVPVGLCLGISDTATPHGQPELQAPTPAGSWVSLECGSVSPALLLPVCGAYHMAVCRLDALISSYESLFMAVGGIDLPQTSELTSQPRFVCP